MPRLGPFAVALALAVPACGHPAPPAAVAPADHSHCRHGGPQPPRIDYPGSELAAPSPLRGVPGFARD